MMRDKGGLPEFSLIGRRCRMATHKPIKWALAGIAGAMAAGVVALQTGAVAEAVQFVQNVIQRLSPRDGSHEEDRGRPGTERSGVLIGGRSPGHWLRDEKVLLRGPGVDQAPACPARRQLDPRSDAMQRQDQPGSPGLAGADSVRDVGASPAGPGRIELRMSPLRLVVSGPALPRVCVERVETTAERARREKAEARTARRGKPPPPPVLPGERQLKERLSLPDVFPRQREAASLTVDGSPVGLMPGRLMKRPPLMSAHR
jgi:hypothetical protein